MLEIRTYILILFGKPTFDNYEEDGTNFYEYVATGNSKRITFFFEKNGVDYIISNRYIQEDGILNDEQDVRYVFERYKTFEGVKS